MMTRLAAFLTTGLIAASSAAMLPVSAAGQPAEDPLFGKLPDWVPTDFADALQFCNTHGKTYVANDMICLVRPMLQWKKDDYRVSLSGGMTEINTPAGTEPKIYELEIPEKPDPDDPDAVAAYEAYCKKLGLKSYDYDFFTSYANSRTQYAFEVELYRLIEGLDLTVTWSEKVGDEYRKTEEFSFLEIYDRTIETDIYSWLPDSPAEFDAYLAENGRASLHDPDSAIVYCAEVNSSTGDVLNMEQRGKGQIKESLRSDCNPFELVPLDGSGSNTAIVYKPAADGYVCVEWTVGREGADPASVARTKANYDIRSNGAAATDKSEGTIFTLIDKDTGEWIDIPANADDYYMVKYTEGDPGNDQIYRIPTNPCTYDSLSVYDPACTYSFRLGSSSGWYDVSSCTAVSESEKRMEVTCELKWMPNGDVSNDHRFNAADAVLLQKWLLGVPDAGIADQNAADFCRDNRLNAADLSMMKRKLTENMPMHYVEPEYRTDYYVNVRVLKDGLELYLGPDESYETVAVIPADTWIFELGYQRGVNDWMFTKYDGKYGWIRTTQDDGKSTIYFDVQVDKPVIYLYPEQETDVQVKLELTESTLATTYPKYNDGWDVTAYPDGKIRNKADGTCHRYLFWDSTDCRTRFDLSKGFCVAGSDTEQFLKEKLTYMGLTEDEMNDFIVYWLPRMEHNAYNLISFQGDAYTNSAKLDITPAPDSECRIFMTYVPLAQAAEIEPQQLEPFERKGFTVVEWGGSEICR